VEAPILTDHMTDLAPSEPQRRIGAEVQRR
jgi:hypothetical protein